MLTYVPALVNASEELLAALTEDPSAWGLAKAFMRLQPALEAAFVPWCGAVGQWFTEAQPSVLRREKKAPSSGPSTPAATVTERFMSRGKAQPSGSLNGHMASPTRKGLASITPFVNNGADSSASAAGKSKSPSLGRLGLGGNSKSTPTLNVDTRENDSPLRERVDSFEGINHGKTLTVRDLAIHPTQRVMRYVLHYRGNACLRQLLGACADYACIRHSQAHT